jgi:hypothetical protein
MPGDLRSAQPSRSGFAFATAPPGYGALRSAIR